MISPHHLPRFEGDSGTDIASQAIDVVFLSGEKRTVILRLGAPFKKPGCTHPEAWWIRTELENLDSTDGPLSGAGSLHTLVMGIKWIVGRLEVFEQAHACRYFWARTNDQFDYPQVLSTTFEPETPQPQP